MGKGKLKMTQKEKLLYSAAKSILFDYCPERKEYYFCKKYIDDAEEIRCVECWENYLLAILNGEV